MTDPTDPSPDLDPDATFALGPEPVDIRSDAAALPLDEIQAPPPTPPPVPLDEGDIAPDADDGDPY